MDKTIFGTMWVITLYLIITYIVNIIDFFCALANGTVRDIIIHAIGLIPPFNGITVWF